jgi:two-component system chemotaxis sensor kinase CheA
LGKPTQGEVKIIASNEGTQVVIQIVDDGKGLDAEQLRLKAVEKQILSSDQAGALSDSQAYQLIFAAGFSTAGKVTDISGRGVGMAVVRNNLAQLHGTVSIKTVLNQGTTFTTKLPTSLMVSKGVLLQASGQEFILPMQYARDLVKLPRCNIHTFKNQKIAQIRGQVYLLAFLGLEEDGALVEQEERSVAIIQSSERRYGLVVDRFVSEFEIIVKPLTEMLGDLKTYLGAAIMGDGRLVLVLNPN